MTESGAMEGQESRSDSFTVKTLFSLGEPFSIYCCCFDSSNMLHGI